MNKIIAEFMDYSQGSAWQYDTNWQWLMPVVEKVESLEIIDRRGRFTFIPVNYDENYTCNVLDNGNSIIQVEGATRIQSMYNAVVEFILDYNSGDIE